MTRTSLRELAHQPTNYHRDPNCLRSDASRRALRWRRGFVRSHSRARCRRTRGIDPPAAAEAGRRRPRCGRSRDRMHVRERREVWLANQEHVHQLAVVRHQRVIPCRGVSRGRPAPVRIVSASIRGPLLSPTAASDANGRYNTDSAYAAASELHQTRPPSTTRIRTPAPTVIAIRARRRRMGSGASPGGTTLSLTATPTIVSSPTPRNSPRPGSNTDRSRHIALSGCECHDRHCGGTRSLRAVDHHQHAVGRRNHQPEMSSVEFAIAWHGHGAIRWRRSLRSQVPLDCVTRRIASGDTPGILTEICASPGITPGSLTLTRTG